MPQLIAKSAILLGNRMFKAGEALPANNMPMVEAWLKSGTAIWTKEPVKQEETPTSTKKPDHSISTGVTPENAGGELKYSASMKPDDLREAGKVYGLTFPVGTKKTDMADALNEAWAKLEAGPIQLIEQGTPPAVEIGQVGTLLPEPGGDAQ